MPFKIKYADLASYSKKSEIVCLFSKKWCRFLTRIGWVVTPKKFLGHFVSKLTKSQISGKLSSNFLPKGVKRSVLNGAVIFFNISYRNDWFLQARHDRSPIVFSRFRGDRRSLFEKTIARWSRLQNQRIAILRSRDL